MHLNIRSLPGKFDKLKLLLSQLDNVNVNIAFILICETYLIERNHDLYHLPGYNFISRHRKQTKCGGVGMYISDKYNYIIRDDLSLFDEHSFESVFVEVLINNAVNIIVGEIYRDYCGRLVVQRLAHAIMDLSLFGWIYLCWTRNNGDFTFTVG